ncbi:hypothetical protein AVEN_13352-1 [Araneus ventricosus]|uniref:Uncharacterized protein n=1 Tax=Araneus ventricosus TaxID=182803 RepID=A0A4Y2IHP9_ARAVE|nr:hypothetical protein AVEN_13352-1 [Araneus ventricosus]
MCHSSPQCKRGVNIFPHVDSMVGRKKQVVGGENGSNFDLSLEFKMTRAQFHNYMKEENDIIKRVKSTLKYDWTLKDSTRVFLNVPYQCLALNSKSPVSVLGNPTQSEFQIF